MCLILPDEHAPRDKSSLPYLGRDGEAARAVGMSRQSAYRLRERQGEGTLFGQAWDQAQAEGRAKR